MITNNCCMTKISKLIQLIVLFIYSCTFSFHRNDLLVLDTPPPIQSKQKASKVHFAAVNEYEHFSDVPESNTVSPYVRTYVIVTYILVW